MKHQISVGDEDFRSQVESCEYPIGQFDHRSHLRLAYTYLAEQDVEQAYQSMRTTLKNFLAANNVDPFKYHETVTKAWILAVDHFLEHSGETNSSSEFIDRNPAMLDSNIMLTHYSKEVLFSREARTRFVEPDRETIPARSHRDA